MSSLVSICIPAYNAELYIEKCIRSILSQSYKHFEIVVVDDASTDDTAKILREFSDNRIKYYSNDYNLGWRGNVKRCYELAQGEFVTILPVDDRLDVDFIKDAIEIFEQYSNIGIWACGNYTFNEFGEKLSSSNRVVRGYINSVDYFKNILNFKDISPPAETMIRNKCIEEVEGEMVYTSLLKQFPEILMYLLISEKGYDTYHSDKFLSFRMIHKNSLTGKYGVHAFLLLDYYLILSMYKEHPLLNEIEIKEKYDFLMNFAAGLIKSQLKRLYFLQIIKTYNIFISNDIIMKNNDYKIKIYRFISFTKKIVQRIFNS